MADIVQLVENGVKKFVKTHVNAIDGMDGLSTEILKKAYPIGSIYLSVNSTNPGTLFGGIWEKFGKGRTLVGVDEDDDALSTGGKVGGSINPLTEHHHGLSIAPTGSKSWASAVAPTTSYSMGGGATGSSGSNKDHANWQPFIAVYMWRRTA